jgi:hypothetical protein
LNPKESVACIPKKKEAFFIRSLHGIIIIIIAGQQLLSISFFIIFLGFFSLPAIRSKGRQWTG